MKEFYSVCNLNFKVIKETFKIIKENNYFLNLSKLWQINSYSITRKVRSKVYVFCNPFLWNSGKGQIYRVWSIVAQDQICWWRNFLERRSHKWEEKHVKINGLHVAVYSIFNANILGIISKRYQETHDMFEN